MSGLYVNWFGKRAVIACGDCDSDGECTMNCGPVVEPSHCQETGQLRGYYRQNGKLVQPKDETP